jgi:hypothetical protein
MAHGRAEVGAMIGRMTVTIAAIGLLAVMAAPAMAEMEPTPVDLLDALGTGKVEAVFYGNGDESVRGRIRRTPFGPARVFVSPGTQFWAQREDVQGMTTLGSVPIDLTRSHIAYVQIPAACTNYARPAPTQHDRMYPVCCPEPRMAALSEYIGRVHPERPVAQIAVWAIANNPEWEQIAGLVEADVKAETPEERTETALLYLQRAAGLMRTAGINPGNYRMFR